MISTPVGGDACSISLRWGIDLTLAGMLVRLDELARQTFATQNIRWPGLYVISGYRTAQQQAGLGSPATNSLHTWCPALAADLRVGNVAASVTTPAMWQTLGTMWKALGGRWGGDFQPVDINHFSFPPPGSSLG